MALAQISVFKKQMVNLTIRQIVIIVGILLLSVLAACVPASVPPQLAHPPGPAVVVAERLVNVGTFQVEYPAGWRVITSAAGDPVSIIFAAPEGDALIMLGERIIAAPHPAGYAGDIRSERREIMLDNGVTMVAILNAPRDDWAGWLAVYESVVDSLRRA